MIQQILEPFDWVVQMPIEDQCRYSIGLSFFGFCIAAVLRESCKDKHIRLVARALGAAAFFAVAAFAVHATKLVDRLEDVVASKTQKATEIDHKVAATLVSRNGNKITIGADEDGVRGTGSELRQHDGGLRFGSGVYADKARRIAASRMGRIGSNGRSNVLVDDVARLFDRTKRYACGEPNAGIFQFSGKTEGEDF
jgi:hypothetical protein